MRILIVALILAATIHGADRVVLLEDFTNSSCGPCWSIEPTLNAFINPHLAAGDLSAVRVHTWWPSSSDPIYVGNPSEQTARINYYNVSGVPTLKMDGVLTPNVYALTSAFNTRMAVPCYLSINVAKETTNDTGTLHVTLTAEQSLGSGNLRLHAILVEDDVPGVGYWAGSVFEQAFRDNLCGGSGQLVDFGSSYPSTVEVQLSYGTMGWVEDNVSLAVFLQGQSSREVYNAWYMAVMDIPTYTGIEEGQSPVQNGVTVSVGPNPSSGAVTVSYSIPEGLSGTLSVFDLTGRLHEHRTLTGTETNLTISVSGIYLVAVETNDGTLVTERVAIIR